MEVLIRGWISDILTPRFSHLNQNQLSASLNKNHLKVNMAPVTPYTVAVSDDRLDRLRKKLELTEFPDELDDAGWDYGVPLAEVKRLTAYWKDGFDWKKQEAEINKLPQYQTKITVDGYEALNIHFIHQKSDNPKAIPLLFLHGCTFSTRANTGRRL